MNQQVTVMEPEASDVVVASPFDRLIAAATDPSVDVEKMERLLGVAERWREQEAKIAYANAIAEAKPELPVILKTNEVSFNNTKYQHEDLAGIAKAIDPVLERYGLSYRFRTDNGDGKVAVTCIVSHRDGHSEETSLSAGADNSGGKNAIQAIGSTVTYLQRYTLKAALGLSAAKDDDAQAVSAAGAPAQTDVATITEKQANTLLEFLEAIGRPEGAFINWINNRKNMSLQSLTDMPAPLYDEALTYLKSVQAKQAEKADG